MPSGCATSSRSHPSYWAAARSPHLVERLLCLRRRHKCQAAPRETTTTIVLTGAGILESPERVAVSEASPSVDASAVARRRTESKRARKTVRHAARTRTPATGPIVRMAFPSVVSWTAIRTTAAPAIIPTTTGLRAAHHIALSTTFSRPVFSARVGFGRRRVSSGHEEVHAHRQRT